MEEAKEEGVLCTFAKTTQVHHYQVYFRYIFPKTSSLLCAQTASCILSRQRTRIEFWILLSKMFRILFLITTLICCLQINAQDRPIQFPGGSSQTGGQPGGSSQTGGQPGGSSQTGGKPDFSGGQPGGSSQTGGQPGGSSQTGGQPGGSSQTGGQPGGSSQTGGQPGGSSQTGGQPGGSSQVGGNIFKCIFFSIKNLSIE